MSGLTQEAWLTIRIRQREMRPKEKKRWNWNAKLSYLDRRACPQVRVYCCNAR